MSTESSSRFFNPKNGPMLVGILFVVAILLLVVLWPGGTPPPAVDETAKAAEGEEAGPEAASPVEAAPQQEPAAKPEPAPPVDPSDTFTVTGHGTGQERAAGEPDCRVLQRADRRGRTRPGRGVAAVHGVPGAVRGQVRGGYNYLDIRSDAFPRDQIVTLELGDAIRSASGKVLAPEARRLTFLPFVFPGAPGVVAGIYRGSGGPGGGVRCANHSGGAEGQHDHQDGPGRGCPLYRGRRHVGWHPPAGDCRQQGTGRSAFSLPRDLRTLRGL